MLWSFCYWYLYLQVLCTLVLLLRINHTCHWWLFWPDEAPRSIWLSQYISPLRRAYYDKLFATHIIIMVNKKLILWIMCWEYLCSSSNILYTNFFRSCWSIRNCMLWQLEMHFLEYILCCVSSICVFDLFANPFGDANKKVFVKFYMCSIRCIMLTDKHFCVIMYQICTEKTQVSLNFIFFVRSHDFLSKLLIYEYKTS